MTDKEIENATDVVLGVLSKLSKRCQAAGLHCGPLHEIGLAVDKLREIDANASAATANKPAK